MQKPQEQKQKKLTLQDYEQRQIDIDFTDILQELDQCKQRIEQNEQDLEAMIKLGLIYIRYYKDKKNSLQYFERVLKIDESDIDALLGKCYCILEDKKKTEFEQCQAIIDKCFSQKIKYWNIYYYQSMLYYLMYKDYLSKKFIMKALKHKPKQYLSLSLLALIKSEYSSEIEQSKYIIDSLVANPQDFKYDFSVFYRAGKIYEKLKEPNQAISFFFESCKYRQNYSQAYKMVSDIYCQLNDFENAEHYANLAIKMDPLNDEAYLSMGEIMQKNDKKDKSFEYFFKTIEINPQNETAYLLILDKYEQMGDKQKEFHELCTQFYKNNPSSADATFEMAYSLSTQKDYYPALKYYKKSLNSTCYVDSYNNIGNLYFQLKDLEEAEHYFLKALKQDPNDLQFNENLNIVVEYSQLVNEGFDPFEYNSDLDDDYEDDNEQENQQNDQENHNNT
ncbi:hypothetical protein ABPG72_008872 [Tetrahymena utriculariae]